VAVDEGAVIFAGVTICELYPGGKMKYHAPMNERITFNPEQCGGRPCIRGMRIRVKDVLDLLAAKVPQQEILEDYPYLEAEDIAACLEYAAAEADHPVLLARSLSMHSYLLR
jgi:uncharacterized protein (DUF433 family)